MKNGARILLLWMLGLLALAGCDSNGMDEDGPLGTFAVRYEVEGTFTGICSAAWTADGGGTASRGITLPFAVETDITPTTRPFAIAVASSCLTNPDGSNGTLTARILVDGREVERTSGSGPNVSLSVGHVLVQ